MAADDIAERLPEPQPGELHHIADNLRNYVPNPRPRDVGRAVDALRWAADEIERLTDELERRRYWVQRVLTETEDLRMALEWPDES